MTKFLQIVFLAVLCLEVNGNPLFQGISFQRGFEINFKPLPRKPFAFIKETWSPFGVFGRKHAIQKRSLDNVMAVVQAEHGRVPAALTPRPAAPVFEHVEEIEHLQTPSLRILPPQTSRSVVPLLISSTVKPLLISPQPEIISPGPVLVSSPAPPMPLNVIITPAPKPVISDMSPPIIYNKPITSNVSLIPIERHSISSNMVEPSPNLFTDIARAEPVREYMNAVQAIPPSLAVEDKVEPPLETNSIKPEAPKSDVVINDNSLIRGSKLALYFGNIFLQLMSQFLSNARATFDQITNPPPVYNN